MIWYTFDEEEFVIFIKGIEEEEKATIWFK